MLSGNEEVVKLLDEPDEDEDDDHEELKIFAKECVQLLKTMPDSKYPISQFAPLYLKFFGRKLILADYGFHKLIDLLEAISNTVKIIDDENNGRIVSLVESWSDIPLSDEKSYLKSSSHEKNSTSPNRRSGSRERNNSRRKSSASSSKQEAKLEKFANECVQLLEKSPSLEMQFAQFPTDFKIFFKKSLVVAEFGFAKLSELLYAIEKDFPNKFKIIDEDKQSMIIQLVESRERSRSRSLSSPQSGKILSSKKDRLCRAYFVFGNCPGGWKCSNSHRYYEKFCMDFLRGNCTRKNCFYPHLNFHEMAVTQMQSQTGSASADRMSDVDSEEEEINNSTLSSADNVVELCESYLMHGNCQYKSKCVKLHTAKSWFCMDYLREGDCLSENCPNPHLNFAELAAKEADKIRKTNKKYDETTQRFDLSERLRNRNSPEVEMLGSETSMRAICRYYRNGNCKKGRACVFRHVKKERN